MKKINLIFLILFGLINKISSLLRRLHKGEEKCIFNDFFVKSNIIITLNISESDINYKSDIKSPLFAISIYTSKSNTKFSFNVEKTGYYKTCIKSYNNEIFDKNGYIIFDLKTESNLDVIHNNNETANVKDFEKVNQKLNFLSDKVEQIENMQLLAKNVENTFSNNQLNSSKRIAWISVLQIVIIFIVGSYNVYAIKDAFKNKMTMPF